MKREITMANVDTDIIAQKSEKKNHKNFLNHPRVQSWNVLPADHIEGISWCRLTLLGFTYNDNKN